MATAAKPTRKALLYAEAARHGREASFVANLIVCWHPKPTRKLAGLVKLLGRGHEVRTAQFAMDILIIDGQRASWADLEAVK
jgi:hypothetical protein